MSTGLDARAAWRSSGMSLERKWSSSLEIRDIGLAFDGFGQGAIFRVRPRLRKRFFQTALTNCAR
jgi:hypothetical protein